MLLASLFLALFAALEFPDDTTYASASEEWQLLVVADDCFGEGGANYIMTHGGAVVWSRHLAFTLRDACVSDQGDVVGWAKQHDGLNFILAAELGPKGALRFVDRRPALQAIVDVPVDRNPRKLVVDFENARFFLGEPDTGDGFDGLTLWRQYNVGAVAENPKADPFTDTTDAEFRVALDAAPLWRLGKLRPAETFGEVPGPDEMRRHLVDVVPVAGTDLLLVRWWFDTLKEEPWLSLVDATGRTFWRWKAPESAKSREVHLRASQGAGRFAIHVEGSEVWHTFRAERDGKDWRAWELGEEAFVPTAGADTPRVRMQELNTKELPAVELEATAKPLGPWAYSAILADGRIVIGDDATGSFSVWSSTGAFLMTTAPQEEVALPESMFGMSQRSHEQVVGLSDGGLRFVAGRKGAVELVEWDAEGALARVRKVAIEGETHQMKVAHSPGNGHLWVWPMLGSRLYVLDKDLREVSLREKDATGRWLNSLVSISFASDGTACLWINKGGEGDRMTRFTESGEPLADLPLDDFFAIAQAADGRADRVLASSTGSLILVDLNRLAEGEAFVLAGIEDGPMPLALSNGETEVWQFAVRERRVRRFALPPPESR